MFTSVVILIIHILDPFRAEGKRDLQFSLTATDHVPLHCPRNSWSLKPGNERSLGSVAALRTPRISRRRDACSG
jgi:hypothetical protein